MPRMSFNKYQGTGNDFIIVDDREEYWHNFLNQESVARLCDRRFGIGADGLMLLMPHPREDFYMKYFNADGWESSMCGNGGRCLVEFAFQAGAIQEKTCFEAIDGFHEAFREPGRVRLRMIRPKGLRRETRERDWVDTGSPHLVVWSDNPVDDMDIHTTGSRLRFDPHYQPDGTNVNFVNVLDRDILRVRTYERGVEAETLSCGTGVTACAYTYLHRQKLPSGKVKVDTPGGSLEVEVSLMETPQEEIWLSGPATFVFSGEISLPD